MSNPFADVIAEYEALCQHVAKLTDTLEANSIQKVAAIPNQKYGDAYVTYTKEPFELIVERGDKKFVFKIMDCWL